MLKRHITPMIQAAMANFPAVLINGARQTGKSTLAKQLLSEKIVNHYVTLDDLVALEIATEDPDGFLAQYQGNVAIDEIQRVPDLLRAIKKTIDENRKPGRFLLTGSANVLSYPGVTESLAGRMGILKLEGLSCGELLKRKKPSHFIEDLFSDFTIKELISRWQKMSDDFPSFNQQAFSKLIFYGGFPDVVLKHNQRFRELWFSSYFASYVERDVRDLSRTLDVVAFSKLTRLVGFRTGNLLNIKNLSIETGLDQRTVNRYLEILSLTFQMHQLFPWYHNPSKHLIKTPKIYANDSGMACYLAGMSSPEDLHTHPMLGMLAETWVWSELRKLLVYSYNIQSWFYRTQSGKEVDFVFCKGKTYWGIEFKYASSVSKKDFSGLNDFLETARNNAKGILLYTGKHVLTFSERLIAVPICCLF